MKESFEILNSFSNSIAVIDSKGVIVFTNNHWKQVAIYNSGGLGKTDLGINYLLVCKEDYLLGKDAVNGILKVIAGDLSNFEMEYRCQTLSEEAWFLLRVIPLIGKTNFTLLSHNDITKRKIAEELLKKSSALLNEINVKLNSSMFKIVHDIQGPLNSILGLLNISKMETDTNISKEFFPLIEASILNLKKFIMQTLTLSQTINEPETVFFKTIFEEYYESIKHSEICSKVDIKFNIDQTVEFYTNKSDIVSIISNIISNSFKYYDSKKDHANISVSTTVSKTEADITIKDNGIGIHQDFLSKVFDLNFQEIGRAHV